MLQILGLTLHFGSKMLLDNASVQINKGMIAGLIGRNGAGKTSLFKVLVGKIEPESGEILFPNSWRYAYLEQELPDNADSITVLDCALSGDSEYVKIKSDLEKAEQNNDVALIAESHERLAIIDGYSIEGRAANILKGLRFSQDDLNKKVSEFSGGWQMRVQLARVLMSRADLIFLDEPTNHLDVESVIWLENWLLDYKKKKGTAVIISHDREFLDNITTNTVYLSQLKLKIYSGNYSEFLRQYQEALLLQQKMGDKIARKRAHMQSFVDRFKAKASKAKQAQSRVKALEKLEFSSDLQAEQAVSFKFFEAKPLGYPAITISGDCGYENNNIILHDVNFKIGGGDRVGIIGSNGSGKTTFLKSIAKEIALCNGEVNFLAKVKIGYFSQQQVEALDFNLSPVLLLQALDSSVSEGVARSYLGGFGFSNDRVFESAYHFSGGEKARVALALLIWKKPNILILDEPTNHLDLQMREALIIALQNYTGALLLVSHDNHLLQCCVNEWVLVQDKSVKKFNGDFNDYRKQVLSDLKNEPKKSNKKDKINKKDKNNIKILEKEIEKLENLVEKLQDQINQIDKDLSCEKYYLPENKDKLDELNSMRDKLCLDLENAEVNWMKKQEEL